MEKPDIRNYDTSTQDGFDAYDADVERYELSQNPKIGTEVVNKIEDTVSSIAQIPIVSTGLQMLNGAVTTVGGIIEASPLKPIADTFDTIKSAAEEGGEFYANQLGVDPRIGRFFGGEVIETLATAGAGSLVKTANKIPLPRVVRPQMATVGGSMRLAPTPYVPPTVMELTATRNLAPGVRQNIAQRPDYQLGVGKLRAQGAADDARRAKFMEQFANGEIDRDTLTERLSKVKKRGDAKLSTLATEADPDIFEKKKFQNIDPTNPDVMMDQHHAATKAMTTPWVKKALEIGDDDDVVALFELHRALTGSGMGNVRSGIIDAPGVVHDTAKARKAGRNPKQAIHSLFKESGAGIEIRTDKVEQIIGNPKNMDELLDKYVIFANEYLIPQKEISLKVVKKELARHRATLSDPAALKDFDRMVEKLNKANTK